MDEEKDAVDTVETAGVTKRNGKNSYDLRVYDPKDYPKLPAFPADGDARFAVPAKPGGRKEWRWISETLASKTLPPLVGRNAPERPSAAPSGG